MTEQERKHILQLVDTLVNYVPSAEAWRVREIKTGLKALLKELYFHEDRDHWGAH